MIRLAKNTLKRILPRTVWERFRARWWRYLRPLTVDYCPIMLPWFATGRCDGGIGQLHRLAMSFHWRNERSVMTTFCVIAGVICWPFQFLVQSVLVFHRFNRYVLSVHHIGRLTQLKELMRLGIGSNVPPLYYYKYRLFLPDNAGRAASYLYADEMYVLHPMLAVELPSEEPLSRKELFFEHAQSAGLPIANAIATFAGGDVMKWYRTPERSLPESDLVLKPVDEANGYGFELWSYQDDHQTWRCHNREFDASAFIRHCCALTANGHTHILQSKLVNHPIILALSGQGLSTIRIVTYRTPDGNSGVLLACMRMPTGESRVDNFETGGIAAPCGLATGMLGVAVAKDLRRGTFTRHPDSLAQITGVTIPYFSDALNLSQRAHSCFPWMPFVGWDVVITENGPLILEANPNFGIELPQIVCGQPLGFTPYPDIYLQHLAALKHRATAA